MKNKKLKLYTIGALAVAIALPMAFTNAQAMDSMTAVGTANSPSIVYSGQVVKARANTANGAIDLVLVPGMTVVNAPVAANTSAATVNYPGVPNTGPIVWSGTAAPMDASGMIRLRGMVSTVTPEAMGFVSGNQTWTIRWAAGINSGAGLQAGDMIEVDGFIDTLYMSQINAVSIREI